jgi:hypothetical protein
VAGVAGDEAPGDGLAGDGSAGDEEKQVFYRLNA